MEKRGDVQPIYNYKVAVLKYEVPTGILRKYTCHTVLCIFLAERIPIIHAIKVRNLR